MRAKLFGGLLAAAALLVAVPAWAGGGHGHGHGHGHRHIDKHHWHKHQARHYQPQYHRRYVVREYWHPAPVHAVPVYPAYPAPAPGVHIVLPGIYIPIR